MAKTQRFEGVVIGDTFVGAKFISTDPWVHVEVRLGPDGRGRPVSIAWIPSRPGPLPVGGQHIDALARLPLHNRDWVYIKIDGVQIEP